MRLDLGRVDGERLHLVGHDLGHGPAVVLVHGWPCSSMVWDDQRAELLAAGYRVVTFDRRGFGRSGRPSSGYDLDTLAEDLGRVLALLDLEDAAVIGFDLGCAELIRLLGSAGDDRIGRIGLIAPPRFEPTALATLQRAIAHDRFQALESFIDAAFLCSNTGSGSAARRAWWVDGCATAAHALQATLRALESDLADDSLRVHVPALVIRSDAMASPHHPDRCGLALARQHVVVGGSTALLPTHGQEISRVLLEFLAERF